MSYQKWQKLYKKIAPQIGLKTPIKIKTAKWWFFDERADRKDIILHCPPYRKVYESVFVHYLGHAKLLEDGWPRLYVTVKIPKAKLAKTKLDIQRQKSLCLYWASRSEDAFFDFYVWQWLIHSLGPDYVRAFFNWALLNNLKEIVKGLEKKTTEEGSPYFFYVYCLDWFGSYYTVAKAVDKKAAKSLDQLFSLVLKSRILKSSLPINLKERITWVRNFYKNCQRRYPLHSDFSLTKRKKTFQKVFLAYYQKVWQGLDLAIKINAWRQRKI